MIQRIEIENFQSHAHTVVEFSDGLNVIAGRSDSGKSAIIRALRWVLANEPSGDSFRSYWGGATRVRLEFVGLDGKPHVVERVRDDSRNVYIVDGVELAGFGKSVPAEITELLPFDELNLQRQFDAPFVLSATPTELGKTISRMFGLDLGQQLLSAINKRKWALNESRKSEQKRLDEIEMRLSDLEWVGGAVELWNELDSMIRERESVIAEIDELSKIVENYKRAERRLRGLGWVDDAVSVVSELEQLQNEYENAAKERSMLETVVNRYNATAPKYKSLGWVDGAVSMVSELEQLIDKRRKIHDEAERLAQLLVKLGGLKQQLSSIDAEISRMETEFHAKLGDTCPLCGQPIQGVKT